MRYTNNGWSIGDPVEVETISVKNLRGDLRREWVPATIASVFPYITVVFADSSWIEIRDAGSMLRIPSWKKVA